jgi:mycothiol synthase
VPSALGCGDTDSHGTERRVNRVSEATDQETARRMTLREFDPARDYAAYAELGNAIEPDYPSTETEVRASDAMREAKIRHHRLVAETDGHLIGRGSASNSSWSYDPRRFHISVSVHPDWRRRGVGTALYDQLRSTLEPYAPTRFSAYTREDRLDGVRFVEQHGFVETMREWESRLRVNDFDPAPYDAARTRPETQHGVRLTDFATLIAEDGEAAYRKLYAFSGPLEEDIPRPEGEIPTVPEYDHWRATFDKSVRFRAESFFIAVAPDGSHVGVSMLFHPQNGTHLDTGLTGVHRDWRRKGIALALKLRAIEYARALGVPEIRTDNASTNRAMLSINEALGFERQPAWVSYALQIVP